MATAIDFAVENNSIALVTADFGCGKTHAAKMWRREHSNVESLFLEFDTFTCSHVYDFVTVLANQLGIATDSVTYRTAAPVFRAIVARLREQPTVLILDQCEMVRVKVLQLVRQLWDRTSEDGVSIVLLSAPQLYSRLERSRAGDLGALRSRIGAYVSLRGLNRNDMAAILQSEGITNIDDEAASVWFQAIGGSMRLFMEGVDLLKSKHGGKRVTERTVSGMLRALMGVSVGANGARFRPSTAAVQAGELA